MGAALSIPIDELEVSRRTSELLQTLGVSTLGALLDLSKIVVPSARPSKIARLVGAALREVFAEHVIAHLVRGARADLVVARPPGRGRPKSDTTGR